MNTMSASPAETAPARRTLPVAPQRRQSLCVPRTSFPLMRPAPPQARHVFHGRIRTWTYQTAQAATAISSRTRMPI